MVRMAVKTFSSTILILKRLMTPKISSVLFLDIDGVLNSAEYVLENPGCLDTSKDEVSAFDPIACLRLEQVLVRTGAAIVLSSTWRLTNTVEQVTDFLERRGVSSAKIIGTTPYLTGYRGNEIKEWLQNHPSVKRFAIVDDGSDMMPFLHHLVQTKWESGLLDEHVEKLVALLTNSD